MQGTPFSQAPSMNARAARSPPACPPGLQGGLWGGLVPVHLGAQAKVTEWNPGGVFTERWECTEPLLISPL